MSTLIIIVVVFFLLLLCVPGASYSALPPLLYECNVTFFGSINMETADLCSFANYHAIMFVVCGTISVDCFVLSIIYCICGKSEQALFHFRMGLMFLVLTLGFEFYYFLTVLFLVLLGCKSCY
jgi:hypothetical protein